LQHARIAGSYLDGVKTVAGGGKTLATALEGLLASANVTALHGVAVTRLHVSPARNVTGIVLEDERSLPVDGVVFTAHPALLPAMLPPHAVRPAFANRLRSLEDTFSTFTFFCASKAPLPPIQGSNLFICTESGIEAGFEPDCVPEKGPFYITGGVRDPGRSTDAARGFLAFAPGSAAAFAPWENSRTGNRPESYKKFKAEKLASLWETITGFFPEAKEAEILDGATPLTNRDYLSAPGCGLYGTKHSVRQFSPLPVTRIPNLWMAGQSVIAPGILGAMISGAVACGFIVGMDTLRRELAACA
jgi:all-trans-retinol 13,14-reductase